MSNKGRSLHGSIWAYGINAIIIITCILVVYKAGTTEGLEGAVVATISSLSSAVATGTIALMSTMVGKKAGPLDQPQEQD